MTGSDANDASSSGHRCLRRLRGSRRDGDRPNSARPSVKCSRDQDEPRQFPSLAVPRPSSCPSLAARSQWCPPVSAECCRRRRASRSELANLIRASSASPRSNDNAIQTRDCRLKSVMRDVGLALMAPEVSTHLDVVGCPTLHARSCWAGVIPSASRSAWRSTATAVAVRATQPGTANGFLVEFVARAFGTGRFSTPA